MANETKATHTPGPWNLGSKWDKDSRYAPTSVYSNNEGDYGPVAQCGDPQDSLHWTEIAAANACLIAAAPEMYEALRLLLTDLHKGTIDAIREEWGNTNAAVLERHVADAEAALAHARGKQS